MIQHVTADAHALIVSLLPRAREAKHDCNIRMIQHVTADAHALIVSLLPIQWSRCETITSEISSHCAKSPLFIKLTLLAMTMLVMMKA